MPAAGYPSVATTAVTDKLATIAPSVGNVPGYYVWLDDAYGNEYGPSSLTDGAGNWTITGPVPQGIYTSFYSTALTRTTGKPYQGVQPYLVSIASNPPSLKTSFVIINAVTDFGADKTGATDAGPAIRAALAAIPSGGSGGGIVYLPPGTYKIASADAGNNGLTVATYNTTLCGAGRDATSINIAQNGLTWGIALAHSQDELSNLTVNFTGTTAPFWLVGLVGVPGTSSQRCRFDRVSAAIWGGATIPVPPVPGANDGVHSVVGAGIFAIGPDYPTTSTFDAGNTHFRECLAINQAGSTQKCTAYLIGNGTSGNVVAITAIDCTAVTCTYGMQLCGGGIRWESGGFNGHYDCDIVVQQPGGDPIVITGLRGENGSRVVWAGNFGSLQGPVVLVDCEFDIYTPAAPSTAGQVIQWNAAGGLSIFGGRISTAAHNTNFGLNTNANAYVMSITTVGLSTDVNPYPAANPARYLRTVIHPLVGLDNSPQIAGTDILDTGSGGVYRARVYRAAALNITSNSVPIVVAFDTAGDDPNGNYSVGASTYTVPVAGRYQVDSRISLPAAAGIRALYAVYVNGTAALYGTDVVLTNAISLHVNGDIRLAAGDVVDVRVNILDNVAKAVSPGSASAYFDISWQGQ